MAGAAAEASAYGAEYLASTFVKAAATHAAEEALKQGILFIADQVSNNANTIFPWGKHNYEIVVINATGGTLKRVGEYNDSEHWKIEKEIKPNHIPAVALKCKSFSVAAVYIISKGDIVYHVALCCSSPLDGHDKIRVHVSPKKLSVKEQWEKMEGKDGYSSYEAIDAVGKIHAHKNGKRFVFAIGLKKNEAKNKEHDDAKDDK